VFSSANLLLLKANPRPPSERNSPARLPAGDRANTNKQGSRRTRPAMRSPLEGPLSAAGWEETPLRVNVGQLERVVRYSESEVTRGE
jgi:hypothetical protein